MYTRCTLPFVQLPSALQYHLLLIWLSLERFYRLSFDSRLQLR